MAALKASHSRQHLLRNRTWNPATVELVSGERWVGRVAQVRDHATATMVNKMLFGWLASMAVRPGRGDKEVLFTRQCRRGFNAEETNWHVLAECKHGEVVRERGGAMWQLCTGWWHPLMCPTMQRRSWACRVLVMGSG